MNFLMRIAPTLESRADCSASPNKKADGYESMRETCDESRWTAISVPRLGLYEV